MLTLVLGFILGAYVESKFATKIGLVIGFVVGLVHKVLGVFGGIWDALKAVFTKKPAAQPAPTDTTPPAAQ